MSLTAPFLVAEELTRVFPRRSACLWRRGNFTAVERVSFKIFPGETLALVGESGSGKTTLGRCLLRLLPASAGRIVHHGVDLLGLSERRYRPYRRQFQMIFQDPLQSLNPRQTVRHCLQEPLRVHRTVSSGNLQEHVGRLLRMVELTGDLLDRYPAELSGGQRQRVAIARALSVQPIFLVADEPTASLDAAVKRSIIELLQRLKSQMGLTLLLISHDLRMVAHLADRIAVMYRGRIVEEGAAGMILSDPQHPYTRALLNAGACSVEEPPALEDVSLPGPEGRDGCAYQGTCELRKPLCRRVPPPLLPRDDGRRLACHCPAAAVAAQPENALTSAPCR